MIDIDNNTNTGRGRTTAANRKFFSRIVQGERSHAHEPEIQSTFDIVDDRLGESEVFKELGYEARVRESVASQ